jgi:D-alanine-D-alanine ligase
MLVILGDPNLPCVGKLNDSWNENDYYTVSLLKDAVIDLYGKENVEFLDSHEDLLKALTKYKHTGTDTFKDNVLVLNLCDEGFRNVATLENVVPCLLELFNIKYTGASVKSLSVCYDKQLVNQTASHIGVPIPKEIYVDKRTVHALKDSRELIEITYPLFVKPSQGDNSLGIFNSNIIYSQGALLMCVYKLLFEMNFESILIQEYLPGDEYSIGVIGNSEGQMLVLPIVKMDFSKIIEKKLPPILNFESKWDPTSPYWTDIGYNFLDSKDKSIIERLTDYAKRLFVRFECCDYARFDFRMDAEGQLKLLEVNPNPGWCYDGKMAKMTKELGLEYKDLIRMIVNAAQLRLFDDDATQSTSSVDSLKYDMEEASF